MVAISGLVVVLLWACAVASLWSRRRDVSALAMGGAGILTGVIVIMLSGRDLGLLWMVGGMVAVAVALIAGPDPAQEVQAFWSGRQTGRLGLGLGVGLAWAVLLLWERRIVVTTDILPALAEVVALAFAHHIWAVVGLAILGLVASLRVLDRKGG